MQNLSDGTEVEVINHSERNTCKVVITCQELKNMADSEIQDEMKTQRVTKVEHIQRKDGDLKVNTAAIVLTIDTVNPPSHVYLGFKRFPCRPYLPRPARFFQCFKFGHIGKDCVIPDRICRNFGHIEHDKIDKNKIAQCTNCNGNHSPTSRDCPVYLKEMEVIKTKVSERLTMREARRKVEERSGRNSFASVVQNSSIQCSCACACGAKIQNKRDSKIDDQQKQKRSRSSSQQQRQHSQKRQNKHQQQQQQNSQQQYSQQMFSQQYTQ